MVACHGAECQCPASALEVKRLEGEGRRGTYSATEVQEACGSGGLTTGDGGGGRGPTIVVCCCEEESWRKRAELKIFMLAGGGLCSSNHAGGSAGSNLASLSITEKVIEASGMREGR